MLASASVVSTAAFSTGANAVTDAEWEAANKEFVDAMNAYADATTPADKEAARLRFEAAKQKQNELSKRAEFDFFTEARVPPKIDDPNWLSIRQKFYEVYGVFAEWALDTPASSLALAPGGLNIMSSYLYTGSGYKFNPFQIELLVNQVADLLERCVKQKETWEENATKAANLFFDVVLALEEEEIEDKEITDGSLLIDYLTAEDQRKRANTEWDKRGLYINKYLSDIEYMLGEKEHFRKMSAAHQVTAALPYAFSGKPYDFAGTVKTMSQHAIDAAHVVYSHESQHQQLQAAVQSHENELLTSLAWNSQIAYSFISVSAKTNVTTKKQRLLLSRRLNRAKIVLCTADGGALNFVERMLAAKARFDRDFSDALDRLSALEEGVSKVYGVSLPKSKGLAELVKFDTSDTIGDGNRHFVFDDYVNFTRNTVAWLLRLADADRSRILLVSLRSLLGQGAFDKGKTIGGGLTFILSSAMFSDERFIRLRGLSVSSAWSANPGILEIEIQAPKEADVIHASADKKVDQNDIGKLRIGGVTFRESVRMPDTSSAKRIHNRSPIGAWNLRVLQCVGPNLNELTDIIIEIQVAYQDKGDQVTIPM